MSKLKIFSNIASEHKYLKIAIGMYDNNVYLTFKKSSQVNITQCSHGKMRLININLSSTKGY